MVSDEAADIADVIVILEVNIHYRELICSKAGVGRPRVESCLAVDAVGSD